MNETIIIGSLIALLLVQQAFWFFVCLKLINRLMSRNFFEYKQAAAYGKKTDGPEKVGDAELVIDPIDAQQAQEMNAILGVI